MSAASLKDLLRMLPLAANPLPKMQRIGKAWKDTASAVSSIPGSCTPDFIAANESVIRALEGKISSVRDGLLLRLALGFGVVVDQTIAALQAIRLTSSECEEAVAVACEALKNASKQPRPEDCGLSHVATVAEVSAYMKVKTLRELWSVNMSRFLERAEGEQKFNFASQELRTDLLVFNSIATGTEHAPLARLSPEHSEVNAKLLQACTEVAVGSFTYWTFYLPNV